MAEMVFGKLVHGYEVRDGQTFCTDCGERLEVGSYATYTHADPVTHGRGLCPNVAPKCSCSTYAPSDMPGHPTGLRDGLCPIHGNKALEAQKLIDRWTHLDNLPNHASVGTSYKQDQKDSIERDLRIRGYDLSVDGDGTAHFTWAAAR